MIYFKVINLLFVLLSYFDINCKCCCGNKGPWNSTVANNNKKTVKTHKVNETINKIPTEISKTETKPNETSTSTLNKENEKKVDEKIVDKNDDNKKKNEEEDSEEENTENNKVTIDILKSGERRYKVNTTVGHTTLKDERLDEETCKPIVNTSFCKKTFIYQIEKNIFDNLKNDENLMVKSCCKKYLIATVLNDSKYYLIVCFNAYIEDENIGLFEKSTNEYVKIIKIGDELTSFDSLLYDCKELKNFMCYADTINIESCGDMFGKCNNLEEICLESIKTNKITYLGGMFKNCKNLKIIKFPKFKNKLNVTNIFEYCNKLDNVDFDGNSEIKEELDKIREKNKKNIKKKK